MEVFSFQSFATLITWDKERPKILSTKAPNYSEDVKPMEDCDRYKVCKTLVSIRKGMNFEDIGENEN